MTVIAPPPIPSADQLRRLERESGVELVDGQIVEKPVSRESSKVEATIVRLLGNEAAKTGLVEVYGSSMGFRCYPDDPQKFRKPDVSVVRSERLAGSSPQDGFITIPADLAVEVVSPNDLAIDLADKVQEYLENGFPLVWVVYPNTRTVFVHRADGSVALLHENEEITAESALPTFRCRVADFFSA